MLHKSHKSGNTDSCERRLRWVSYSKHILMAAVTVAVLLWWDEDNNNNNNNKSYLDDLAKLFLCEFV